MAGDIGLLRLSVALGCTDELTAKFLSDRTGEVSVHVSSKAKQLGTWRISNYTPEFRETSGVGKRKLLTMDEVLRLAVNRALVIARGNKVLQVDKYDYTNHYEAKKLRDCKASAHVPEWRKKPAPTSTPKPEQPKCAPRPNKPSAKRGEFVKTDKDSIMSTKM